MDVIYLVSWSAGELELHESSEKRALDIAVEYIRDSKIIKAELKSPAPEEPAPPAWL